VGKQKALSSFARKVTENQLHKARVQLKCL